MTDIEDDVLAALLALLVHDLRNPLSALHSNIDFVGSCSTGDDPELRGALDDALVSCEALGGIIDNIEILSHALSQSQHVKRPEQIAAVVSAVVQRHQTAALSHGVKLELDSSVERERAVVSMHRGMLERALGNLIKNAIQHAPSGSVVRVRAASEAGKYRIEVCDAGVVLDEAARAIAFSAPGQVASKSSGRYSRGLGLMCARLAAHASGAEIRARAGEDGGSVFELSLTAAK